MVTTTSIEQTARESVKFALVGGTGVVVNFVTLSIALYLLHLSEPIALALGIAFSLTSNYALNRIWTFRSDQEVVGEYIKYIALNGLGILIQYFVALGLELYFDSLSLMHFDVIYFLLPTIYVASFVGIIVGFISNFLFSKYFVF